ncbi:hypothetical protein [Cyanothece sp. BG0011]|uniref:hypothetical protein n=1 Tax=Cyanothece sp. BG0011 TaxID=2082950 RepID=UPI001300505E|nr:hypothetical protein [Cyanothece sp. BG0011]
MNKTIITALTLVGASATFLLGSNSTQATLIYDNMGLPMDETGGFRFMISRFAIAVL